MSGRKAFLDTNLFIYLIEENELYNIKTPDADLFVTNDDRLSWFEDNKCKVVLLSKF